MYRSSPRGFAANPNVGHPNGLLSFGQTAPESGSTSNALSHALKEYFFCLKTFEASGEK
jgi:hypothetical protein